MRLRDLSGLASAKDVAVGELHVPRLHGIVWLFRAAGRERAPSLDLHTFPPVKSGNMLQSYWYDYLSRCIMARVATTKLSSKGQVVIPEEIRRRLGLKTGSQFVVVGNKDTVVLKAIAPPSIGGI